MSSNADGTHDECVPLLLQKLRICDMIRKNKRGDYMTVKELIARNNVKRIYGKYLEYHDILEDYEKEVMSREQLNTAYTNLFKYLEDMIDKIKEIETEKNDNVIFVVWQKDTSINEDEKTPHSWMSHISDIKGKVGEEFTLWDNNGTRIEHYAYDMSDLKEIVSSEVYCYEVDEVTACAEIMINILRFGFDEEQRTSRINEIVDSLKETIESIEKGELENEKYVDIEDFFDSMEDKYMNPEEKENRRKEKEERKKNEERDRLYSHISMKLNHKVCISAVESYFLEKIKLGDWK
jgi:hypothetical protein